MNSISRILALREGGQTKRCHTIPYIGPYNVAIHSYNALVLLLALYPRTPRLELIQAVMFHDTPERWTGDVPTPAKISSPLLRNILDSLEQKILDKLGFSNLFSNLAPFERHWLTAVDLLELYIWGKEQELMGNQLIKSMNDTILKIFEEKKDQTPKEIEKFLKKFKLKRVKECHELIKSRKLL